MARMAVLLAKLSLSKSDADLEGEADGLLSAIDLTLDAYENAQKQRPVTG